MRVGPNPPLQRALAQGAIVGAAFVAACFGIKPSAGRKYLSSPKKEDHTNGIALTPALARELVRRRIDSLVVSIDGRESNADVRGVPTGQVQACSRGLLTGFDVNRLSLDEIWNHPWYTNLRRRLYAKRFEELCTNCPFQFGSRENQVLPIRPGVHHSHEVRLRA